jgi:hypothetical protein
MSERAFEQFATAYRALSHTVDDAAIDRLVATNFRLELELAPDILRCAVRRALRDRLPPRLLWDALHAMHRDVLALSPVDRAPAPRPFAAPSAAPAR